MATSALTTTSNSSPNPSAKCEGALVTGADYRGLGIVRSLGRRGVPVLVLRDKGHLLGASSRYASRTVRWPSDDPRSQLDFLGNLAIREGLKGWALFPTSDEHVTLVARHHKALATQFRLTIPSWDTLQWVCNKRLLYVLAQERGVTQPWSFFPRTRAEVTSLDCQFPVILKPVMRTQLNRFTKDKAWRVTDRASLLDRYDDACALVGSDKIMVQELVPGWGEAQFSYAALFENGRPLASVIAQRLRQFPMDFGRFSTYVETVDAPEVAEAAERLLAGIDFSGIAEIEFKRDPRNGEYKLLDVNPRVWGWHTLGQRAGVDFPHLLWLLLNGESTPEVRARAGERWMRLSADVPMALYEILNGRLSVWDYLRSLRVPVESAIFAWDDPLPGLLEFPSLLGLVGKRLCLKEGL